MPSGPDQITDATENQPSPDNQGSGLAQQPTEIKPDSVFQKTFNRGLYVSGAGLSQEFSAVDPKTLESIQKGIDQGRKKGTDSPDAEVQTAAKTGFTNPPVYPDEVSKWPLDMSKIRSVDTPTMDRIRQRKIDYNLFQDYAGKQFTHLFDYFVDQKGELGNPRVIKSPKYENGQIVDFNANDIYLGSFVKTFDDNEDPTYLGFDLKIKTLESPLFNGTAEAFITQFAGYGNSEIASRLDILNRFKTQFRKFLRTDIGSPQWENVDSQFTDAHGVKTYYMKKISGLNNLVESYDGAEGKQFVEYGKDFITLSFNEDVTQNIGYLAHLYKLLSYSRLHGKLILPPNVLRFDVDLEITEVRKMNRHVKVSSNEDGDPGKSKIKTIYDKIAKYTYTLYECEFFFPTLPHGDTLDMSTISEVADYEIKFNYKWSSMKFTRFKLINLLNGDPDWVEDKLDNKLPSPSKILSSETTNSGVDNSKIYNDPLMMKASVTKVTSEGETLTPADEKGGELEPIKKAAESGNNTPPQPTDLITDTTNVTVETPPGTGKSIGEQLASSAIQRASDSSLITGPVSSKINQTLEQLKSIEFPLTKGKLVKSLDVNGVKNLLQGKLKDINFPIKGKLVKSLATNGVKNLLQEKLKDINFPIKGKLVKSLATNGVKSLLQGKLKDINFSMIKGKALKSLATNGVKNLLQEKLKDINFPIKGKLVKSLATNGVKSLLQGKLNDINFPMIKGKELKSLVVNGVKSINEKLDKAKDNLIDSGIKTINKSLLSQASLLNKTLGNISSQKTPKQSSINSQLSKNAVGAAKNFVGRSLKSFFTK